MSDPYYDDDVWQSALSMKWSVTSLVMKTRVLHSRANLTLVHIIVCQGGGGADCMLSGLMSAASPFFPSFFFFFFFFT